MIDDPRHFSVLGDEAVAALRISSGETYVDGTFGAGGYTRRMLDAGARVVAFDRDPTAISAGRARFADDDGRVTFVESPFDGLADALAMIGYARIDGAVFDFGVSSMHLDEAARGFSFMQNGPLDMRMGRGRPVSEFINSAKVSDLADVIFQYGEERRARHVANLIGAAREEKPIVTTGELAAIAERALGKGGKIHPATRLFQALRIFVNDELGQIVRALIACEKMLREGGRLVVVSFHSLEDRIVKRFLAFGSGRGGGGSRHEPEIVGPAPTFVEVAKPVEASANEVAANVRSRSAIMRTATRTAATLSPWTPQRLSRLGVPPLVFSSLQQSWVSIL